MESQEWSDQEMVGLMETFFLEKKPRFMSEHKYERSKRERN